MLLRNAVLDGQQTWQIIHSGCRHEAGQKGDEAWGSADGHNLPAAAEQRVRAAGAVRSRHCADGPTPVRVSTPGIAKHQPLTGALRVRCCAKLGQPL